MERIKEIIKNFDGKICDVCYEVLVGNEESLDVFQFVCENLIDEPQEKNITIQRYFDDEEITLYKSIYGDIVNSMIKSVIKKCNYGLVKPDEFYKILWEGYCACFNSIKEKAFALYYTVIDQRIPYIYLGKPLSMDKYKYSKAREDNRELMDKIEYIFNTSHTQKTEIVSLILQCIESVQDHEAKVIALIRAFEIATTRKLFNSKKNVEEVMKEIVKRVENLEKSNE